MKRRIDEITQKEDTLVYVDEEVFAEIMEAEIEIIVHLPTGVAPPNEELFINRLPTRKPNEVQANFNTVWKGLNVTGICFVRKNK